LPWAPGFEVGGYREHGKRKRRQDQGRKKKDQKNPRKRSLEEGRRSSANDSFRRGNREGEGEREPEARSSMNITLLKKGFKLIVLRGKKNRLQKKFTVDTCERRLPSEKWRGLSEKKYGKSQQQDLGYWRYKSLLEVWRRKIKKKKKERSI